MNVVVNVVVNVAVNVNVNMVVNVVVNVNDYLHIMEHRYTSSFSLTSMPVLSSTSTTTST